MSPAVITLTLTAAVLHATWNALLRSGKDRLWSVTVMSLVTAAAAVPLAVLLPIPAPASWSYIGSSAVLQLGYGILLAYAYGQGELGQVYPLIRGSVPLLVTLAGFLLAGQRLGRFALLGIALVSLGIVALGSDRSRPHAKTILLALATAGFVASYLTIDGLGVRLAGNAQSYVAWIFLCYGALQPLAFRLLRRTFTVDLRSAEARKAIAAGAVSLLSYGALVTALALGKLGPVSALRETSVVFSVLVGRLFLGERLTRRRLLACLAVASGAACIGSAS
ncbi:MAG TPA: DMT family transporter [Steroidobacteraceae bacterium]|nr:DMT family transporter [Steroidobacteraceae bacterium]